MTNKITKRKRRFYILIGLSVVLLVSGVWANRWVKTKGYRNLWDFVTTTGSNYSKSWSAEYKTIQIYIDDADFAKMEAQRERALERGIMINEEDAYVPALLVNGDEKAKAEIRLKGHMMDHLQKNKWSFRVKTDKKDALMGMKRFTLQHPGTRNYIYEWIYHEMAKAENIMALRYDFVRLMVNDEDWGIYAVEEHFGQELIQHNHSMPGPVIRFNPELYWTYRINELNKIKIDEPYAEMQSAFIEAYDTKNTLKDDELKQLFENAMQRLEAFRRGEMTTSQVFDVKKLASFHAIIDVVGGHHSLDWSDVKYFYNSQTQLLEPVAYESFSIRETKSLSGSYRFTGERQNSDLHDAIFNDPDFYTAYIQVLERIASKNWMDDFLESIDPLLNSHLKVLYKEFPYKNYSSKDYYKNIKNINQILSSPISFHAHFDKIKKDSLYLNMAGIDALPLQIDSLTVDSITLKLAKPVFIPAKKEKQKLVYREYVFSFPYQVEKNIEPKIKLHYHIPGSSTIRVQKVFNYPAYNFSQADDAYLQQVPNVNEFKFLVIDEQEKMIHTLPGKHALEKDLIIPAGYVWKITENVKLDLLNNSKIISHSPLQWKGTEESPIKISSSDHSGQGLIVLNAKGPSEFSYVIFNGLRHPEQGNFEHKAVLNSYRSHILMQHCEFSEIKGTAIQIANANLRASDLIITEVSKDALKAYFSNLDLNNVTLSKISDDGLVLNASFATANGLDIKKCGGKGMWIKEHAAINVFKATISSCEEGVVAQDAADVIIGSLNLSDCLLGIKVSKKGDVFGPAHVLIRNLTTKKVQTLEEVEKKSSLRIEKKNEK